ncbi:predicted protein, partial [Nematostella vectensis]
FLTKYGYLVPKDPRQGHLRTREELTKAIRMLQRFAGLNETGVMDAATIAQMGKSRCGMPDFSPADKARRKKRYQLHGTFWKKNDLTYRIKGYTSDLPKSDQERIYKWAFAQWTGVSKLKIREASPDLPDDKVDILIDFVRGYHGDGYPFDGPGGTLAHAFYPHNNEGISGDAHFDDDEDFTTGKDSGINLDWVALHEFGHSLGIDHSEVHGSIMFPWYQGYKQKIQLTWDDVMAIQGIYGTVTVKPYTGPTTPTKFPPAVDMCKVPRYDAWLLGKDGVTYAFTGDYYFTITDPSLIGGKGPFKVADKWKELRTPIDAAYTRKDGRYVFFKDGFYWKYYQTTLEEHKPITAYGLPEELSGMDGIFVWGRNSRTYIFKDGYYWRYDEYNSRMDLGYPRQVDGVWKNIPDKVDAIMKWRNEKTYFFKSGQYWRLDDFSIQSESGYPQSIAKKWMLCSSS